MWAQQLKAARALAGIEQTELASMSGVSVASIKRFEAMTGPIDARTSTVQKLRVALEGAGILFIPENGNGPGVRLRDKPDATTDDAEGGK